MPITTGRQWENPLPQGNVFQDVLTGGANFINSYMGAEKEKGQYERDLFKTMASGLASTKQIRSTRPGEQGMMVGGKQVPWVLQPSEDTEDLYRKMQIKKAGIELGLPGYEPTEQYLQNTSIDEADKQLNRSYRFQTLVGSPKLEDQVTVETIRKMRAKQIYDQMKSGYGKAVTAGVETAPQYEGALPTDQVFKDTDGKWKVKRAGKVYPLI